MDNPIASSSRLPPPFDENSEQDPRLSFQPASQAQIRRCRGWVVGHLYQLIPILSIVRAHQRDSAQIWRLTELVSEVLRSIAGTRWLAHKQTIIDLLVKAVYLSLMFGRGTQTLGEEYTDILPYATRIGRAPSRRRRALTIIFLLVPSLLTSPTTIAYLRNSTNTPDPSSSPESTTYKWRMRLLTLLDSPWARVLPEIHMIAFLFRGRFFDLGRRLTGLTYISTLPAKPPEQAPPSYEPLGLLMLLPFLYRITSRRRATSDVRSLPDANTLPLERFNSKHVLPLSPPLTPPPTTPEQTLLLTKGETYDSPNTYLTPDALMIPERHCTLCLEPRGTGEGSGGTVAVTECGHVFCWGCLGGLEKLECPLCRQTLRMERLVAAYNL